jgi:L-cysteine S-thiosulfotransferase
LKRFNAIFFAFVVLMANHAYSQSESSNLSPEQDRAAIIQALQKRLPGTRPEDWIIGSTAFEPGVTAIPLSAANATNTADILAIGKKRWDQKFKNSKSFSNCFPNGGKRIAGTYPQFEPSTKQVITIETALNRCLQLHGEATIAPANVSEMGPLAAYARSLSEGQSLNIRVLGQSARDRFDAGRRLFNARIGQQNFACASCHVQHAGGMYGANSTTEATAKNPTTISGGGLAPAVGQAVSWPRVEPGGGIRSLHAQFQRCFRRSGAEPFLEGSDEFNNLEYYLAYLSNGLPLRSLATTR